MWRIAAFPLLLALICVDTPLYRWGALAGYVVACVTDYFDGYFARHMKQISPLGRFLDPIADKPLFASLIVMLVATQQIADLEMIPAIRSEEHTSELQSLMRISYAVFCLKKKNQ